MRAQEFIQEVKARYEMTDLDPWTFDQTPAGWRGLPSSARQADALNQYIDRYVKDGQFVGAPQGVKTVKPYILYWHLGQVLTQMGRNAMASRVMRQALDDSDLNWNAYVMATISFLRKDRKDFDHWAPLARGNEETIKRLTDGWGRPYKQVYAGQQGVTEDIDPYRLERLDPQTRRVLTRMADHKEPGSWLSASEAYAMSLGLQYKNRDPRGWEQDVQRYVDLYRQYSGQGVTEVKILSKVKGKGANPDQLPNRGSKISSEKMSLLGRKVLDIDKTHSVYRDQFGGQITYNLFNTETNRSTLTVFGSRYPGNPDSFIVAGLYASPDNDVPAAEFYRRLITDLGLTLVSDRKQSPGGQRVWQRLEQMPGIEVHGYDTATGEVLNIGAGDEEMYAVPAAAAQGREMSKIARDIRLVATAR